MMISTFLQNNPDNEDYINRNGYSLQKDSKTIKTKMLQILFLQLRFQDMSDHERSNQTNQG